MYRRITRLIFWCLAWLLWLGAAHAASWETLVMPGKLIQGHAKYEEQCDKCHESFSKKSQRRLCLDCHKEIAADVRNKHGLHGLVKEIQTTECKQCHSDHLGRNADVVQFNRDQFDHDKTDYPLKGAHIKTACGACHVADKPYRKTQSTCYQCHRKQDVHKEKFGKKCEDCHSEERWNKTRFDHDKTDYKLTGKHREVSCNLCHLNGKYKDTPKLCIDCHRLNDVHRGKYGTKCQECHSTRGWKSSQFDHDKKTKFPLKGKHKDTRCDSCHRSNDFKKKLKMECDSCHKRQDIHKGVLGARCQDCHAEVAWKKHTFSHKKFPRTACIDCHKHDDEHKGRYGDKCDNCHKVESWGKAKFDHSKTKYPLKGKHRDVSCTLCHQGDASKEKDKTECYMCHRLDDVHRGKQGDKCQQCHSEAGWRERVVFDHDLSRFPLIGMHAAVPCEDCHISSVYKETKRDCNSCHNTDDEHKGRLGERCGLCHNPNSWKFWQFNHDKDTKFALKDAHKEITCESCHKAVVKDDLKLATECYACHRADDVHSGNFGRQCDRCHNQKKFDQITLRR
jgi:hypothetical protein